VSRSVQEPRRRILATTQALTGELGRSPTVAEIAQRTEATVEEVLAAHAVASAHFPDSLNRPVGEDGREAIEVLPARDEPGFNRVEDAIVLDGLLPRFRRASG
jgi:RNA polymerase sigma-B factor